MLHERVLAFFHDQELLEAGDTVLVAASGGPDSTALLFLMLDLRNSLGIDLQVAHLDHGFRGHAGRADARFVAELAESEGLTLHHRAVDVPELRRREGGSLEAVARRMRYRFLEEAARKVEARWILTGHCADDQVETVLLNLLRGAGSRGLGGMLPFGPGGLCRPLLDTWKDEILLFLEEHDLPYRVDATNQDLSLTRNWIRNLLMPLLQERISAGVPQVLNRAAHLFAELNDYLDETATEVLDRIAEETFGPDEDDDRPEEVRIGIPGLTSRHPALQRIVLRSALERLGGGVQDLTMTHIDSLLKLVGGASGSGELHLPRGLIARREYERLILSTESGRRALPPPVGAPELNLTEAGEIRWGNLSLRWMPSPAHEVLGQTARGAEEPAGTVTERAFFDRESLRPPVVLRSVRPGDRLEPRGMAGSQKVSNLLINRKVPRHFRPQIGVLCDNGGPGGSELILWVIGQRLGRHAEVRPESSQVVVIQAETTL